MKKLIHLFLLMAFCTLPLMAQGTFVYTNDDRIPNSISAFSAAANGVLSPVPGSPFPTGGTGSADGGFFASNAITTSVVKHFLYAGNSGSNNVSAFSIDPVTGVLTSVPGSPFATGGVANGDVGMSLTTTPDDKFLIVANGASMTISVFSVAANGALSPVAGSPFASGASGELVSAKVTWDGKFLAVTSSFSSVSLFNISATGALTPVPGSPTPDFGAAGIDCNCASTQLYVALNGTANSTVDVFDLGPSGTLSRIAGSPFAGPGVNSNVAVLSPDDSKLFTSAQASHSVTVFSVASGGALTVVAGSPYPIPGLVIPVEMATNQAGTLLYLGNLWTTINGFSIGATGALTEVPGSPFSTNGVGHLSLAVFPPKNCCPAPVISGAAATPEVLWPPNHKMVDVTIDYTVVDPCPNTCVLTVSSNEPINGTGDGNTSPDWEVIDAHHVRLRAERAGNGSGRIYTINITCTNDTNKLSSTKTLTVEVPHDQGSRRTGVFRPSTGELFLKNANSSGFADSLIVFGNPGDYPIAGDWNGDGVDSVGIYRNGVFYLRDTNSTGFADIVVPFGNPGDQPVVGDWDGDGVDTIGIYRNGTFILRNSNTAGPPDLVFTLGNPGDIGIAGDWNGDGITTCGVFRPSNGIVYLKNSNTTGFADLSFVYGIAGDKPVAGDWNGDGIDTVGVYRNGVFYLTNSNTTGFADIVFALGNSGDSPIAGNWDGSP